MDREVGERRPLISLVMPAYNAQRFIAQAIRSVLAQSWQGWELIIVNDGSTDSTGTIVRSFQDERIHWVDRPKCGVSRARNEGLDLATGEFLAFIDADDILPPESLSSRAGVLMSRPDVHFVDGVVRSFTTEAPDQGTIIHRPTFKGAPREKLLELSNEVFFGLSWMIRRTAQISSIRFPVQMSHAEDLAYYLLISPFGSYDHTEKEVLYYRRSLSSAMRDLDKLALGYSQFYALSTSIAPKPSDTVLEDLWKRICSIMFKSYLLHGKPLKAIRSLLRNRPNIE